MTRTRKQLFEVIRPFAHGYRKAGSPDTQAIGLVNQLADHLGIPPEKPAERLREPKALRDPAAFFAAVRGAFGPPSQDQVSGFNAVLGAMGKAGWPIAWAAYALATAWHETARTMQPVREAYWLSDDWRKKNLRYYPWYGRGYVQLTWEANYRWADEELELGGELLRKPDLAMDPDHAAAIMVRGMEQGAFCKGHSLAKHLPETAQAGRDQFKQARRIINLMDKADEIAGHAVAFQKALSAGGWK